MGMTYYMANAFLNYVFRESGSVPAPGTYYVGLSTSVMDATGSAIVSEPSGGNYARQSYPKASGSWVAPTLGVTSNNTTITFPESTNNWGTIKAVFIADSQTGGNILYYYNLDSYLPVPANTQVKIQGNNLIISGV